VFFKCCKFRLSVDNADLSLQAAIGGTAKQFHVSCVKDKVFRFSVSAKPMWFFPSFLVVFFRSPVITSSSPFTYGSTTRIHDRSVVHGSTTVRARQGKATRKKKSGYGVDSLMLSVLLLIRARSSPHTFLHVDVGTTAEHYLIDHRHAKHKMKPPTPHSSRREFPR
jgi:hypothetical protein